MEETTGSVIHKGGISMALKKGKKIWCVYIDRGIITAFTKDMEQISLTRSQRNTLREYKSPNYIEKIVKEFQNNEPLHKEFSVMKDGVLVYAIDLKK